MKTALRGLGFSETEAIVYLALLRAQEASVAILAERTALPRSTVYDALKSLIAGGFVSNYETGGKQLFRAQSPEVFREQHRVRAQEIESLVPRLQQITRGDSHRPSASVYHGLRGIIALLGEVYQEKQLLVYGSASKAMEALHHLPENLARRRVEQQITLQAVFERAPAATFRLEDPHIRKLTKIRFLPTLAQASTVTFIYGNRVAIMSLAGEDVGYKIDDPAVAATHRTLFEILWNKAEK